MIPHKFLTMDDIMEITFPLDSSLLEYAPRIILFFNALLKIFIILEKHLAIGKNIILIMWMQIFTLTLLSPQLHLMRKAKGCKISMAEAMMALYVMTWMIV